MDTFRRRLKNRRIFLGKDAKLGKRVRQEFVDNGIATVPCKVSGYEDIISSYSVEGYETLNSEFVDYVTDTASFIPYDYPIALEICGCRFSEKEKETIMSTIKEDFMYELGAVQKSNKRNALIFLLMIIGMVISGFMLSLFSNAAEISVEFIYIIFWFFADFVVSYFCLDGYEDRKLRCEAGRLASMSVSFSEEYDDKKYSDEEINTIYEDIQNK